MARPARPDAAAARAADGGGGLIAIRRDIGLAVGGALLLRLVLLHARGDYIVYDEGYYLLIARNLAGGHGFSLNGLPHVALSPLQPLLVAGLTLAGVPLLWASRLLAAVAGALLVVPVAFLARRWYGERAGLAAAFFAAASPALLTFLPFFPGERWNLYFGSEPLFLLLGASAIVAAIRATDDGGWRWWMALGALVASSYLARLEGAVLGLALALATLVSLATRGRLALLPRALAGALIAAAVVAPYLLYLHGVLGRWAVSGRVQAAAAVEQATAEPGQGGGSDAVRAFVWGGDQEALWRTLYALDESGTRMASQYWGVP
ncbi:MAG: glycosyltransferase family 39 protein, partial [Gemmatimonadales bacterium]|nr:glycosyltransferase family 39 protein [Gemmatimonadales bacterium]